MQGAGSQIASKRRVCLTLDERIASAVKHEAKQGSHPHMKRDAALSNMHANKHPDARVLLDARGSSTLESINFSAFNRSRLKAG